MSGHSKWHNIQVKKGKADRARANIFTKLSRMITVAAQSGGEDPDTNFSLRLAIDRARAANVPKDNIERAIKRGTGELKDGAAIQEAIYEGYGPGGVAFLVEAVTDNVNRTVSDMKAVLHKHEGSLGGPGSVQWQFERLGLIRIPHPDQSVKNDFELTVIDAGASDIIEDEERVEIRCSKEVLQKVLNAAHRFAPEGGPVESSLVWIPKDPMSLDDATNEKVAGLVEALEELDDVGSVYVNVN